MHTNHLGNVTALGDTTGGLVTGSAARYNLFGNYRTTPTTDAIALCSFGVREQVVSVCE